jgi:hypothetical protein
MSALGWHQQLITLVCAQFCCGQAAVLPHGGLEPTLYIYCDVANVLFADEGKKLSLTLEALKYG